VLVATAVSRRVIYRVLAALIAGTALWVVFRPSDERAVENVLRRLAEASSWDKRSGPVGRFAQMRQEIEAATAEDLVVRIPDVEEVAGGRLGALHGLYVLYQTEARGLFSLEHVHVTIDADRNGARAAADATLLLETGEHTTTDTRRVMIRLQRRDGEWKVAFVDVAAKPKDQPEARP
jgi:hypothetical protein